MRAHCPVILKIAHLGRGFWCARPVAAGWEMTMNRVVAIALCGLSLGACSGMPSMPSFSLPTAAPAATTVQFESEPAGAEAKTSTGQTCRTPCSLTVAANEFTATFTHQGYQPQTVPVRIVPSNEPIDPNTGEVPPPRLVPNPVYVELQPAPPPAARKPARSQRPRATTSSSSSAPRPAATRPPATSAPPPPPAPAPAPAAPWPPPPPAR
jgi:hypothetical protein